MTMTPEEYKSIQEELGWRNEDAAKHLQVSIKTIESWRRGTNPIHGTAELALRLIRQHGLPPGGPSEAPT